MCYHQDGLVDVAIGAYVLVFGLGMLTDMPWLAAIFIAPWTETKRKIAYPTQRSLKREAGAGHGAGESGR